MDCFCRTRPERNSLTFDVALRKECTNPRGQDSRLVATLDQHGVIGSLRSDILCCAQGIDVYLVKKTEQVMVWVLVCRGDTQHARQIIASFCDFENDRITS